jgi:arsenite methyltransferase
MTETNKDIWYQWLLHRRFSREPQDKQADMQWLFRVRDRVLDNADLTDGDTLLDVGCGDGLIAFGALDRTTNTKVIFSDISQDLLDHTQSLIREKQVDGRSELLLTAADDLSALGDGSTDVVTTRSVLIYVSAKQKAFNEFYRVLKPGGRLSIFEPINNYWHPSPAHIFMGCDVSPVIEISRKLKAFYAHIQPEDDAMFDFNERDLINFAEIAGFSEVHLELEVHIQPPLELCSWEAVLHTAGNPKIPSLEEAMKQALTPEEAETFVTHLRPLMEANQGTLRGAVAYLWAVK